MYLMRAIRLYPVVYKKKQHILTLAVDVEVNSALIVAVDVTDDVGIDKQLQAEEMAVATE